MKFHIPLISFASLLLLACNENTIKKTAGGAGMVLSTCSPLDFESTFKNLIQLRCNTCHTDHLRRGYDFRTLEGVKAKLSDFKRVIQDRSMPKNAPLDPVEEDLVLRWIAKDAPSVAAPEDVPNCKAEEPSVPAQKLEPNYDSIRALVLKDRCVICHNPKGKAKAYDFSSYQAILKLQEDLFNFARPERSVFVKSVVVRGPFEMPPEESGLPRVTEGEAAVITEWIRREIPEKGETL